MLPWLTHLEAFVLKDAFDGSIFASGRQLGLEDNAKGAIAHDLALGVLHITSLASNAVLDLLADHLCRPVSQSVSPSVIHSSQPPAPASPTGELSGRGGDIVVEGEVREGFEVGGVKGSEGRASDLPPIRRLENIPGLFCDMLSCKKPTRKSWPVLSSCLTAGSSFFFGPFFLDETRRSGVGVEETGEPGITIAWYCEIEEFREVCWEEEKKGHHHNKD